MVRPLLLLLPATVAAFSYQVSYGLSISHTSACPSASHVGLRAAILWSTKTQRVERVAVQPQRRIAGPARQAAGAVAPRPKHQRASLLFEPEGRER